MRIAFVGKGGSGKTTLAYLFTEYLSLQNHDVIAIDADINMNFGQHLRVDMQKVKNISDSENTKQIKDFLKGDGKRMVADSAFRKTTPPTRSSQFFVPHKKDDFIRSNFATKTYLNGVEFMRVGTYVAEGIGTTCYHTNLTVLENILSHGIDTNTDIVVDMVAGTDAFSNTLHFQFDLLVLVLEPNKNAVEVYNLYKNLSEKAGMWNKVVIVGNKVFDQDDLDFLEKNIDKDKFIGYIGYSKYLKDAERDEKQNISLKDLEKENQETIHKIYGIYSKIEPSFKERYDYIVSLHRTYIKKDFITERYGDISLQIDEGFDIDKVVVEYGKI
mgnify:CR=1 FL=1